MFIKVNEVSVYRSNSWEGVSIINTNYICNVYNLDKKDGGKQVQIVMKNDDKIYTKESFEEIEKMLMKECE